MAAPARRRPLVLVGFMGAGKSTVGRLVAKRLGVPFVDSDEALTTRTGRTPAQIFATDGEPVFRRLEREMVAELVGDGADRVVALGGGAVEDPATRTVLRDALVVHLDVSHAAVLARVGGDRGRPVLARPDLDVLHRDRLLTYREVADVTVSTDGRRPAEVAALVLEALALRSPASDAAAAVSPNHPVQ
jgi:shikimate kinase